MRQPDPALRQLDVDAAYTTSHYDLTNYTTRPDGPHSILPVAAVSCPGCSGHLVAEPEVTSTRYVDGQRVTVRYTPMRCLAFGKDRTDSCPSVMRTDPQPVSEEDPMPDLSALRTRLLDALEQGPMTRTAITTYFSGGHTLAVQAVLEGLVVDGLVASRSIPKTGGRPATEWYRL
jgi:hypothetical protein